MSNGLGDGTMRHRDGIPRGEDAVAVATAESLAAELCSRGWVARTDTWIVERWGKYPVCVIETNARGDRVEMDVYFDRFEKATWFDYSEKTQRVPIGITAAGLADLVIASVGDGIVRGPE